MSYLKEMKGKNFEKAPSQVMLIYQVQDINKLYDKGIAYEHESMNQANNRYTQKILKKYFSPFLSCIKKGKQNNQNFFKTNIDFNIRKNS